MAELLLSPGLHAALLLGAVVFAFLTARRPGMHRTFLSALCAIAACLLALAAGRSPAELVTMVLLPAAVLLLSQRKGGSDP